MSFESIASLVANCHSYGVVQGWELYTILEANSPPAWRLGVELWYPLRRGAVQCNLHYCSFQSLPLYTLGQMTVLVKRRYHTWHWTFLPFKIPGDFWLFLQVWIPPRGIQAATWAKVDWYLLKWTVVDVYKPVLKKQADPKFWMRMTMMSLEIIWFPFLDMWICDMEWNFHF